jgi:transcription elongation factor Elf1
LHRRERVADKMSTVVCPHCGHERDISASAVIETRTVGVTPDWQTWTTVTCEQCEQQYMYRTD